jgi:hypothetical protein
MSQPPKPPLSVLDERPASLANSWIEPCPDDGYGVLRLERAVYEFPLLDGRLGALHCYGDPDQPLATFVSIFDRNRDPIRVEADAELYQIWARNSFLRPDYDYQPINPVEAARIRATFATLAPLAELRAAYWVFAHQVRERLVDGRRLRLESRVHRDYDDEFELFELSDDGQMATSLEIHSYDEIQAFETAAEHVAREEHEREQRAERERRRAERADRGLPEVDPLDNELPF